jgi:hypothetical protein
MVDFLIFFQAFLENFLGPVLYDGDECRKKQPNTPATQGGIID